MMTVLAKATRGGGQLLLGDFSRKLQTSLATSAAAQRSTPASVGGPVRALYNKFIGALAGAGEEVTVCPAPQVKEREGLADLPGPRGLPLLGSALDYTALGPYSPNEFTVALRDRHETYGPIFRERIMDEEFVYVSDPKDIAVLVRNEGKHPCRPHLEVITESRRQQGLPVGVTAMQGEEWLNNRNAANPVLMRPRSVQRARGGQHDVARDFVRYMAEHRCVVTGEIEDFEFALNKWALESVAVVLLDMRLGLLEKGESESKMVAKKLHHCMDIFFDYGARLTFSAPWWKLWDTKEWQIMKKSQKDEFKYAGILVDQKLADLQKTSSGCPFSSAPASTCPVKKSSSAKLSRNANSLLEHVISNASLSRSEALTLTLEMLAGGIDTTSTAAIFLLYQLARNPDYQQKLREMACESRGADPSRQARDNFVRWMKACSFEAMRLNPLTYANARKTDQDLVMGGYHIPAGTTVRFTSHLMNLRDPEYFPEPERFIPERWMDKNSPYACKEQFTFTPFGHGARQCPGRRVAQQELDLLFRELLTTYQVDYHHEDIGTKVRLFNRSNRVPKFSFTPLETEV